MDLTQDHTTSHANYASIQVGQSAEYERTITNDDIMKFADVSGDYNPVHIDEQYAASTIFKGRIAHGFLSAAFISTAIASRLPGPGSIYLKQDLAFKYPVRIGDTITTTIEVIGKEDRTRKITLKTTCRNQKKIVVIDGQAVVTLA